MDSLLRALILNTDTTTLAAAAHLVRTHPTLDAALADRVTYDDLDSDPHHMGILDAMRPHTRLSWVARHVGDTDNLELWYGTSPADVGPAAVAKLMDNAAVPATHLTHLASYLDEPTAWAAAARYNSPGRAAAYQQLYTWGNTIGYQHLTHVATSSSVGDVLTRLVADGIGQPGRTQLIECINARGRTGNTHISIDRLLNTLCDQATASNDSGHQRDLLAEIVSLCANDPDDREGWHNGQAAQRLVTNTAGTPNEAVATAAKQLIAAAGEPANTYTFMCWAAHTDTAAIDAVLEQLERGDNIERNMHWRILSTVAHNPHCTADQLHAVIDAGGATAILSAINDGQPYANEIRARVAEPDATSIAAAFTGVNPRDAVAALTATRPTKEVLGALIELGWIEPGDAGAFTTTTLNDVAWDSTHAPLHAWIAEQLGTDPRRWELFAELGGDTLTINEVLDAIDAANGPARTA